LLILQTKEINPSFQIAKNKPLVVRFNSINLKLSKVNTYSLSYWGFSASNFFSYILKYSLFLKYNFIINYIFLYKLLKVFSYQYNFKPKLSSNKKKNYCRLLRLI